MSVTDRVIEWAFTWLVPVLFRVGGIMLLAWAADWESWSVWPIIGALILWDVSEGWRRATRKNPLFSKANCAICGQPMRYEENNLTVDDGEGEMTRLDWHFTHTGPGVIDRIYKLAGL